VALGLTGLLAAACGGAMVGPSTSEATPATAAPPTSTTRPAPTTTSSTTTTVARAHLPAGSLVYGYVPEEVLTYSLELDQTLRMRADGDPGAFGEDDLPLTVDLDQSIETAMTYSIGEGPLPGTTEMTITAEFSDLRVSGTANGEPFDPGEDAFDLDEIPPIDVAIVVDEKGRPVSVTTPDGESLPLGDIGAFQAFGTDQLGRPLGPVFPEGVVGVGDTWTDEQSTPGPDGEPISSRATHTIVAAQLVDGHDVLVIESVTESDGFEFDLAEVFAAIFAGFGELAGDDGGAEAAQAELEESLADLEFVISADPSTATATTWFDPLAGIVRRSEQSARVGIGMRFRGPDAETGRLVSFTMDMEIDQHTVFRLLAGRA
jgi:hypothetical protein